MSDDQPEGHDGTSARSGSDVWPIAGRVAVLTCAIAALAFGMRIVGASTLFRGGVAWISPLDDQYHHKRITWSAQHFPRVLQFDPDRGINGEFCPWPPLYDLGSAAVARLFGATSPDDVLAVIVWIPPAASAILTAIAVFLLARRRLSAAVAFGLAAAFSVPLVKAGSIGSIDHHFLEPFLVLAILGAVILCLDTQSVRGMFTNGLALAGALLVALLTQTAMLPAAGLAFVAILGLSGRNSRARFSGVGGFTAAAAAIALYRLTRPAGYPDSAWFLGWTHVATLAAAAVALIVFGLLDREGRSLAERGAGMAAAVACGALVALVPPESAWSIVEGGQFFGGAGWFGNIGEFRPLWRKGAVDVLNVMIGYSAGLLLVWPFAALAFRRREPANGAIAFFAIAFLGASISSVRWIPVAVTLLALAGAVYGQHLLHSRRRLGVLALALVAAVPLMQSAVQRKSLVVRPGVQSGFAPWYATAEFFRAYAPGERVLAPWTIGHLLDVAGGMRVVIDNFGTMTSGLTFEFAHDAFLNVHDEGFYRYCRDNGIRFVAMGPPTHRSNSQIVGVDPGAYVGGDGKPTALADRTWWSRAWTTQRREIPHFRLVFEARRVRVWERID